MKPLLIGLLLISFFSGYGQFDSYRSIDSLLLAPDYAGALVEIQRLKSAAQDQEKIDLLSNKEAETLILIGRLNDAEALLKGIKSNSPLAQAITRNNLGFLKINQARFDQAIALLQESYRLFQSSNQLNGREGAKCLANLALLYSTTGKYNQAKENELQALAIRQQLFGDQSVEVAASLNDLGLIYSQIDTDLALEYYEKALLIYEKIYGKEHPKIAIAKTNIGFIYQQQELYGDAINYFEEARAIWEKVYPNGHPNVAQVNIHLGNAYENNNPSIALDFFEKALGILRKSYGDKHPDISQTLNEIGMIKLNQQKFDEALSHFHEAVRANAPSFNSADSQLNPSLDDHYNAKVMLYSIHLKALALEGKHYGKTLRLDDLVQALSHLQLCDKLIDHIRHQSTDESDKIALGELAGEVYEDGVKIAEAISLITLKGKVYQELAFYFAEKSKSAVLQESIADTQAKSYSGIPTELLEQETNLKTTIAWLSQKLSQKPNEADERQLRQSLFTVNQQYNEFVKSLEQQYPGYFNLKYNTATVSISDVQKKLDDNTSVISYFVSNRSGRLYIFVINNTSFKIINRTLPAEFDRLIRGYNNSLYYSDFTTYQKSARPLSKLLLVKTDRENLVIIPSGRLGTLPFEALSKTRADNFASLRYLVQQHSISYEFSAGLLLQKGESRSEKNASIFLCAPVRFNQRNNLGDLPGTESEVSTIAGLFQDRSTKVLLSFANELAVKNNNLQQYDFLHFATHGIVDEVNPELSRIFLNPTETEDGDLYSGEIYNLKLNANLAVLSACQTGLGKFSKGEGVIGLSRALTYAGARNIVVSYWSVSDESTAKMMKDFYTTLLKANDLSFANALRQAKLNLIQDPIYSAPYYWAPFILIGK